METKKNKRTFQGGVQVRQADDGSQSRTIEGYAALYNTKSQRMGESYEVIAPGAFDNANISDVRALFNHDPSGILARTTSGTLELSVDERGLKYRFEAPNTTLGNDLLEMIRRGDISQSSFAFNFPNTGDDWFRYDSESKEFTILRIDEIFDVSPVTYPAYTTTTVAARSMEQAATNKPNDFKSRARHLDVLRRQNQ